MAGASSGIEGQRKRRGTLWVLAATIPDRRFPCRSPFNDGGPRGHRECKRDASPCQAVLDPPSRSCASVRPAPPNWPEYGSFSAVAQDGHPRCCVDSHVAENPDRFLVSHPGGCYTSPHVSADVSRNPFRRVGAC